MIKMKKYHDMKQFIVCMTILALASCFGKAPKETGLEGKAMPDFSLLLPDSTTWVHTRDIPAGKSVALFYFSPYCPYCRDQTREIIEDMEKVKNIQFYFITSFSIQDLKAFNKEYNLDKYPNIISAVDTARSVSDYFEITGVPYIAIYNKNKQLNKTYEGKIYSSQIKKAAEE